MSKWLIITVSAVLITVGIVIGFLLFFINKSRTDDDAADEIYLRAKKTILNDAIEAQLDRGILSVEGKNLATNSSETKTIISRSNNLMSSAIAKQKDYISKLREKYDREMKMN